jgi:hypothetical protein
MQSLARPADTWDENNCLVASTSIIIRSLFKQFNIPILYILDYKTEKTHEEFYKHFKFGNKYGQILSQSTLIQCILPMKLAWHDIKATRENYEEKIQRLLSKPSTSCLKVITLSIDDIQTERGETSLVPLPKIGRPFKLVAMQCMKPNHYYSIFNHHRQWYEYDNTRPGFKRINEPENMIHGNPGYFTITLFYLRKQLDYEPVPIILSELPSHGQNGIISGISPLHNLSYTIGHDETPRRLSDYVKYETTATGEKPQSVWEFLKENPNDSNSQVILLQSSRFATMYSSLMNPMVPNVLYKTYIYNPKNIVDDQHIAYIPNVYRRFIIVVDTDINTTHVLNYLLKTYPETPLKACIVTNRFLDEQMKQNHRASNNKGASNNENERAYSRASNNERASNNSDDDDIVYISQTAPIIPKKSSSPQRAPRRSSSPQRAPRTSPKKPKNKSPSRSPSSPREAPRRSSSPQKAPRRSSSPQKKPKKGKRKKASD